ncbi:MAG: PAS domain-containing protein, partial [Armatimonadetes bacterium]|nr:PAS domain-containing protein [Armatimonadota bacterium]
LAAGTASLVWLLCMLLLRRHLSVPGILPLTYLLLAGTMVGVTLVVVYNRVHHSLMLTTGVRQVQRHAQLSATHILRTLDVDELLRYLVRTLYVRLKPTFAAVYVKHKDSDDFVVRAYRGDDGLEPTKTMPADNLLVKTVAHETETVDSSSLLSLDQVRRFRSLDEARLLTREFERLHAHIIAPLVWENELVGLIMVGPKSTDDMYGDEDMAFIAHLATTASLGLNNATLYAQTAQLKDFNESILREMDNAVIVADSDGRIVVFNNAAERLFGIPASEVEGASIYLLPTGIANCIRSTLSTGHLVAGQHTMIPGDQPEGTPVTCSVSPLRGNGTSPSGAIAVVSDLTLTHELERERQEAERLALIRVISAGMAHEIRNPLVAIKTFTELAPERMDDPEFRSNFLTVAKQEIDRINKLVGDLLTLSKPADAVMEMVDVNAVCQQVVNAASGIAEAAQLQLTFEQGRINGTPLGDAARIHQALLNLVTNAIDAEPAGGVVRVSTREEQDDDGRAYVVISVYNSGSYIPPTQMEDIFRPFYSGKDKGTGLGLAICKTIVEEHRGEIVVSSSQNEGTEFVVKLPLTPSTATAAMSGEATT